jgi:hypothetical protein
MKRTLYWIVVSALLLCGVCNEGAQWLDGSMRECERSSAAFRIRGDSLYRTDGRLAATGHLDASGSPDGPFVFYYPDGSVESRGDYSHGLKDGVWARFSRNGDSLPVRVYDVRAVRKWAGE